MNFVKFFAPFFLLLSSFTLLVSLPAGLGVAFSAVLACIVINVVLELL